MEAYEDALATSGCSGPVGASDAGCPFPEIIACPRVLGQQGTKAELFCQTFLTLQNSLRLQTASKSPATSSQSTHAHDDGRQELR